jgi:hypothetical protein
LRRRVWPCGCRPRSRRRKTSVWVGREGGGGGSTQPSVACFSSPRSLLFRGRGRGGREGGARGGVAHKKSPRRGGAGRGRPELALHVSLISIGTVLSAFFFYIKNTQRTHTHLGTRSQTVFGLCRCWGDGQHRLRPRCWSATVFVHAGFGGARHYRYGGNLGVGSRNLLSVYLDPFSHRCTCTSTPRGEAR